MLYAIIPLILFVLSFLSGMMGLGVAFIATPVLGLFGLDLKNEIMPLTLWLNGLTAIASAVAYSRARMVDWRTAVPLLLITTLMAPLGVWVLRFVPTTAVWWIYVGVLVALACRMAFSRGKDDGQAPDIADRTRVKAGALSAVIAVFAGFLGVGPGFLLMPTLVLLGYTARLAAATNSVIVTLPSFSAFFFHLAEARFDWTMLVLASLTSVLGAQLGARFMAKRVKSPTLTRLFASALVLLAAQRIYLLLTHG